MEQRAGWKSEHFRRGLAIRKAHEKSKLTRDRPANANIIRMGEVGDYPETRRSDCLSANHGAASSAGCGLSFFTALPTVSEQLTFAPFAILCDIRLGFSGNLLS